MHSNLVLQFDWFVGSLILWFLLSAKEEKKKESELKASTFYPKYIFFHGHFFLISTHDFTLWLFYLMW